jgi:hypothetical protein
MRNRASASVVSDGAPNGRRQRGEHRRRGGRGDASAGEHRAACRSEVRGRAADFDLAGQETRITYDPTLGYPISINIDPVTSIPGDEVVYKVTSFEALP